MPIPHRVVAPLAMHRITFRLGTYAHQRSLHVLHALAIISNSCTLPLALFGAYELAPFIPAKAMQY
jgi:hypothetical protein